MVIYVKFNGVEICPFLYLIKEIYSGKEDSGGVAT